MKRGRPKKFKPLNLNFKNYFVFVRLAFVNPKKLAQNFFEEQRLIKFIVFFELNLMLGLLISVLFKTLVAAKIFALFLGLAWLSIDLISLTILSVIFGVILHFLAKSLGGSGSFLGSLKAVMFCSPLLILMFLPIVWIIGIGLMIYLLSRTFLMVHQYSEAKAMVNILIPIIVVILIMTGFAKI